MTKTYQVSGKKNCFSSLSLDQVKYAHTNNVPEERVGREKENTSFFFISLQE